jgi:hypothetical protein
MIKIAHRGNTKGPNKDRENAPGYLKEAIRSGYHIEVDVWVIDNKIFLGHDNPQYQVDIIFLNEIKPYSWFHCKNLNAILYFINNRKNDRFFWHQSDDFTLTSNGYIWTYPEKKITEKSIIVDLDIINKNKYLNNKVYGICSDYVSLL